MVVRHRLLEHGELDGGIVDGREQMSAEKRLVDVRGDLGDERRVACRPAAGPAR